MFNCKICNYSTNRKFNLDKHLISKKHLKNKEISSLYVCKYCDKTYKYYKSYINHKCNKSPDNEIKEILKKVIKENEEMKKDLKNIKQINNYHVNINIFLNNECNNAINWFDFIRSINIGESELNEALNTNITSSIINVLLKGISTLGKYKRPIHCVDLKRKKLCIRDNNIWIKDHIETLSKINKGEQILQGKYIKAANNLDYNDMEEKYIDICEKISNDINDSKILRKISNETHI